MDHDIIELIARLTPSIRKAFLESIADVKSEAQLTAIIAALARGDVTGAMQLIPLRAELFEPLDQALRNAYLRGGVAAMAGLPVLPDPFPAGVWLRGLAPAIHAPNNSSPRDRVVSSPATAPAAGSSRTSSKWSESG